MIVVVFRSRLIEGVDVGELEAMGTRMYELASAMPGFVSYKDFQAADGESLTLVEFEAEQQLLAWRNHPEHVVTQQRARAEFFADYHITVCEATRAYRFDRAGGRRVILGSSDPR